MWLFTKYGFFSVSVQGAQTVVRARLRKHLEALATRFGHHSHDIVVSDSTDYRYRVFFTKEEWAAIAQELTEEQTWSNFKNEVSKFNGRDAYESACHDVWSVMHKVQLNEKSSPKKKL